MNFQAPTQTGSPSQAITKRHASSGTPEEQHVAYSSVLSRLSSEGVFEKLMPDAQGVEQLEHWVERLEVMEGIAEG